MTEQNRRAGRRPRPDGAVPDGFPHVGLARTALYNWAFARHHGGTFVFRIEDTDAARNTQESYDGLFEVMHWLGLGWDEGPDVGGPFAPYRQSERADIYLDVLERARHVAHLRLLLHQRGGRGATQGLRLQGDGVRRVLPRPERGPGGGLRGRGSPTGRPVPDARRRDHLRRPGARRPVTFHTDHVPDFALARANGDPLYTLVNPVDDALMEITHVLRGEDLLSSTPRQIALYDALEEIGVATGRPRSSDTFPM